MFQISYNTEFCFLIVIFLTLGRYDGTSPFNPAINKLQITFLFRDYLLGIILLVIIDTSSNGTAANRIKIYV
jgi:hypothetical protein